MKALAFLLLALTTQVQASFDDVLVCQTTPGKTVTYIGKVTVEARIYPPVYTVTDSAGLTIGTNLHCKIQEQVDERPSIQSSGTKEVR